MQYSRLLMSKIPLTSIISRYHNMPKFCANLSFMFTEKPFEERYQLARDAGFKAVESAFPLGISKDDLVNHKTKANVEQILINTYTDTTKGEFGYAAVVGQGWQFDDSLKLTIDYAKSLGAKKIHIMSGKVEQPTAFNDERCENNLWYASKMLEKENIIGLIEPINKYSLPNYYMDSYEKALSLIKKVNSPNLKLMLDIFHLQQIQGDITHTIKDVIQHVGHVQIAQVPNRNEPDTAGEINYQYVFDLLESVGYNDWIGLEYKPSATTVQGLKWIKDFNYTL
ncbi:putative hydroxypyruvate isomerase isoform X1 [Photinus pyralis]|nr:putative hydroxypyruvate isomerase isoform X1 [Photinus pyralis]XP_031336218.1 putative hydroxypyruvate isomerase isoform X1 [Photinus pyralis]